MQPPAHIELLLKSMAQFRSTLSTERAGHRVVIQHNAKNVDVLWPEQLSEVFLDFVEHGTLLLAESVEYYNSESPAEQAEYIANVVRNFLLNETKVVTVGALLKRKELQFWREGGWSSVFGGSAQ